MKRNKERHKKTIRNIRKLTIYSQEADRTSIFETNENIETRNFKLLIDPAESGLSSPNMRNLFLGLIQMTKINLKDPMSKR